MLLQVKSLSKAIGHKYLFENLNFSIHAGEKIALIGRNGQGKTTLLKIFSGQDHDYEGTIVSRKDLRITLTQQEHSTTTTITPLQYILNHIPHYHEYKRIIENYEQGQTTNLTKYLEVLEYFTAKRYFHVEEAITSTLKDFNISASAIQSPLASLSGGEKRYVEMTKLMFSGSDLFLVDEPTNHMDYIGKNRFISWMKGVQQSVVVVTHDRDVLKHVTKIIELKNKNIEIFKGNYDSYLAQNALQTLTSVKLYNDQLNRLKEAKKRVEWGLQMRATSKQWKIRYDHWVRDYEKIKSETVKQSFWIDQTTIDSMDKRVTDSYLAFKEKNIAISIPTSKGHGGELVAVRNLSLGYDEPLFEKLNFTLRHGERVFLKGRNGAGKSTLVKTLIAQARNTQPPAIQIEGEVKLSKDLRVSEYQQEIDAQFLTLPLEDAIWSVYEQEQVPIDTPKIKSLLAQYLFDPVSDGQKKIEQLSGGQKARFQLLKMFVTKPNLLILDEPTNHLDLPSIEELEKSLKSYTGGILYISHDTYFISNLGGAIVQL